MIKIELKITPQFGHIRTDATGVIVDGGLAEFLANPLFRSVEQELADILTKQISDLATIIAANEEDDIKGAYARLIAFLFFQASMQDIEGIGELYEIFLDRLM